MRAITGAWVASLWLLTPVLMSPTLTHAGAVHAGTPTLPEYRHSVHGAQVRVDRMLAHGLDDAGHVARLQASLRHLGVVRLPDGKILVTDTPAIAGELRPGDLSSVSMAASALDTLDRELGASRSYLFLGSRLDALDTVLAESQFHPSQNPLTRLRDRLGEFLTNLLTTVFSSAASADANLSYLVIVVFLVVIFAVAINVARTLRQRSVSDPSAVGEADDPVTSEAAARRASEHADQGDYRMAFRYRFLATLIELQERKLLDLRPGITNREYLRAIRSDPRWSDAVQQPLQDLIDEFDRSWYGHEPFGRHDLARCEQLVHRLLTNTRNERAA